MVSQNENFKVASQLSCDGVRAGYNNGGTSCATITFLSRQWGDVVPYMRYIGTCSLKGYCFSAVLVINRVSIFTDWGAGRTPTPADFSGNTASLGFVFPCRKVGEISKLFQQGS